MVWWPIAKPHHGRRHRPGPGRSSGGRRDRLDPREQQHGRHSPHRYLAFALLSAFRVRSSASVAAPFVVAMRVRARRRPARRIGWAPVATVRSVALLLVGVRGDRHRRHPRRRASPRAVVGQPGSGKVPSRLLVSVIFSVHGQWRASRRRCWRAVAMSWAAAQNSRGLPRRQRPASQRLWLRVETA